MLDFIAWLPALSLLSLLSACNTLVKALDTSETVEVDLIFPRNDTYDPIDDWPVLFAVQNFEKAQYLDAVIRWDLQWGNNESYSDLFPLSSFDLKKVNTSRNGTQFFGKTTWMLAGLEANWILTWRVQAKKCNYFNESSEVTKPPIKELEESRRIVFTTKNGAAQPNYTTYTESDACHDTEGIAFDILRTLPYKWTDIEKEQTCAWLSETQPSPDPCAVKIDNKTAIDITYEVEHPPCINYASTDECRKATNSQSHAALRLSDLRWTGFLSTCVWLHYFLL